LGNKEIIISMLFSGNNKNDSEKAGVMSRKPKDNGLVGKGDLNKIDTSNPPSPPFIKGGNYLRISSSSHHVEKDPYGGR
jgi:hypothetical protein